MNDVLTKPLDIDQLKKTFNLLGKGQSKFAADDNAASPALSNYRLPGIDVESGLSRLRNDAENYKKLLQLFYKNYQGKESLLEDYLEQKNWAGAEAWLHALKGICANLSISGLDVICIKLHAQLKTQSIDKEDLQQFKRHFTEVIQGLQQLVESES